METDEKGVCMKHIKGIIIFWGILNMAVTGCSGTKPDRAFDKAQRLPGCPDRPNCVSSESLDAEHRIEPFVIKGDPLPVWKEIRRIISDLPRTVIVEATDRYLHAESKSRIFGFIDDLELQLDLATGAVCVRSASRVGYSDMGVNRRRVEELRDRLRAGNLIEDGAVSPPAQSAKP